MKTKYTPGPWIQLPAHEDCDLLAKDDTYRRIKAGDGFMSSKTHKGFALTGFMNEADARLMAAAPELLDALILALEKIGPYYPDVELINKLEAVVYKATGMGVNYEK